MFFLRSIRRRLVTGFAIILLLVSVLAGAGIIGLFWHQNAVLELEYVLYQSPNRDHLTRQFSGILNAIRSDSGPIRPTDAYAQAVRKSIDALNDFRLRISRLESSKLLNAQRHHIERKINAMDRDLRRLLMLPTTMKQKSGFTDQAFRDNVNDIFGNLMDHIAGLPEYQDRQNSVAALAKEQRESAQLRSIVGFVAVGAIAFILILLWCGFQWISNPLREITLGASRIAEGDHEFRIPRVSRWQDEFSTLRGNVNLMADRFEQAETDLHHKVRERSNQLVRSERLAGLGFLSAGVAHEINNPRSIIRVAADTLDYRLHESLPDDAPDRDDIFVRLKMIRAEAVRCGEITARVLDFARGEQKTPQMEDLTRVIESVLAMIRPMPDYRDRQISFERTEPLMLWMNGAQMKQVTLNLVFNALQATAPGGHVEIRLIEQVDWVVLEIEDDGCGMSCETMENLFEPFYSTKPPGQGTGLGMPITHRIIADHDGTIEPVSAGEGQGALMRVRLPVRQSGREVA